MTDTMNLGLPCIEGSQAQKHVTHNDALRILDTLVQLAVLDRDLTAPPASPSEGQRWIVKTGATGLWAGHANAIAAWQDGGWQYSVPKVGWVAFVADEGTLVMWNGTAWDDFFSTITSIQNLALLGIGTTADSTSPLSAKLNNALFAAKTVAEGGDGHLRYKLSKESAAKTLSFLFQDNWSGRAEIGLTGDDDFHFKVSPDGASWYEGIRIDRTSGKVSFPTTGGPREILTADRTYYVRTDGSDANDGLANSAPGAFATLQKAYDLIASTLDLAGFTVTVEVDNGTYSAGLIISQPWTGGGAVTFHGDTVAPTDVTISTSAATTPCISIIASLPGILTITGFKLITAGASSDCVSHKGGGTLALGANNYGACTRFHASPQGPGAVIRMDVNYTISGSAACHWLSNAGGYLTTSAAVTLSGTPNFSAAFAYATRTGIVELAGGASFPGAATGKRYSADTNGVILASGLTLPGDIAGTTASGGQYA